MTNPSEHEIQGAIIDLIRVRGGVVTRVNSGSMIAKSGDRAYRVQLADKGTSDVIALYKGVYLAIEVKGANGKPTPEQIAFLESVARAGGVGLLAYDSEFVDQILCNIDSQECGALEKLTYIFNEDYLKTGNSIFME
jgi:Holliday junction resolvase